MTNEIGALSFVQSPSSFNLLVIDTYFLSDDTILLLEGYALDHGSIPVLYVVEEGELSNLRLPVQGHHDFVLVQASYAEFEKRLTFLLWPEADLKKTDTVTIDDLTVNLSSYEVFIANLPVDLTLMEYSLFSFLVTHPSRVYSREILLHRVWGFEYCGGTRTVDVHVRRIRSKIGPKLASRIQTIRGVGYLFRV